MFEPCWSDRRIQIVLLLFHLNKTHTTAMEAQIARFEDQHHKLKQFYLVLSSLLRVAPNS